MKFWLVTFIKNEGDKYLSVCEIKAKDLYEVGLKFRKEYLKFHRIYEVKEIKRDKYGVVIIKEEEQINEKS